MLSIDSPNPQYPQKLKSMTVLFPPLRPHQT